MTDAEVPAAVVQAIIAGRDADHMEASLRLINGIDMVRVVDGLLVEHWSYAAPLPNGE